MTDLIVCNVQWRGQTVDITVRDGRIASVTPADPALRASLPEPAPFALPAQTIPASDAVDSDGRTILDGRGLLVWPSLIDAHVHLREPGLEYKEDICTGLWAAACGGVGTVMCMANTNPVNDNADVTAYMLGKAAQHWPHGPRLVPIGALTKGLQGRELAPMAELAQAGCRAFSNDGLPVSDTEIFRRAVEYASDLGLPVIDHCEDPYLGPHAPANEGHVSGLLGLAGQPTVSEALHVARDILLAEYLDTHIHLAHISCAQSVDLIRWAKSRNVKITAETCPQYLLWTEELLSGFNSLARVNPPLRTPRDVESVRAALADGTIDILVTDHAPHAEHEKNVPLAEAANGISGLDTAMALTWTLITDNVLTMDRALSAWTFDPATIFNLPVNTMAPGDPADFFLFDPAAAWEVTPQIMRSKGKNTPLLGETLHGRVRAHFIGGVRVA